MTMTLHSLPWASLLLLGALHGMNPAMGWLFAVGRGLQQRERRAVWRALGPLALGHGVAIAAAIMVAIALGPLMPGQWIRRLVAAALIIVGLDGLRRHRHVSLRGMRVNDVELATWSFLVASAHGAGLMVLPFVLGASAPGVSAMPHQHHEMAMVNEASIATGPIGIGAPVLHTLGYLAMTAALALLVYEKLGVRVLRRAWLNVNVLWSAALIVSGVVTALR
jgi:hypothetical protein